MPNQANTLQDEIIKELAFAVYKTRAPDMPHEAVERIFDLHWRRMQERLRAMEMDEHAENQPRNLYYSALFREMGSTGSLWTPPTDGRVN